MFEGLTEENLEGAIEAMLFVTDEPVSVVVLAEMLDLDVSRAEEALRSLQRKKERDNSGVQVREAASGFRLVTHPAYHKLIEKYVLSWDTRRLSSAAVETLAVIAYTQPATRSSIASIRGVNSESTISSLVEKGLVRELGVADTPGSPTLYGTTQTFLEKFGLRSIDDLTPLSEYAPDEEMRALITQRLQAAQDGVSFTEEEAADALYGEVDAVEKINFDELEFDFDDE